MGLKTSYNGFGPKVRDESWAWLKREMAEGRLSPPTACQGCGETRGHLDYHTEDYSKPFGPHIYAYQLCFRCHMMTHVRFRQLNSWFRYIKQLEVGAIYEPLWSRKQIGAIWEPRWVEKPVAMGPPRGMMVFFRSLGLKRAEAREPVDSQGRLFD